MLLKAADDKSKRVRLLQTLQDSNTLNASQKKWLRDELMRLTKGIEGERDSAYYIDGHFKDSKNHVVVHDLRFVVDDEVAQIDHLVINRVLGIYLVETKNYACNLLINERGEFTADYGRGQRFGVPSPLEQSKRHARVLVKVLQRLEITGRLNMEPEIHHVVMLHPKAIIQRPPRNTFDTGNIIKADQFPAWHQSFVEGIGGGGLLKSMVNVRSPETITAWAEKLMRQHRPADLLALPEFILPHQKTAVPPSRPNTAESRSDASATPGTPPAQNANAKHLICAECGSKISFAEGKYCWNHPELFGGQQYCREHQRRFTV